MRRFLDVFDPTDRLALFVVSMTMAANDVKHAMSQSDKAVPADEDDFPQRQRFGYWVRVVNGYLFEGITALQEWQKEVEAAALLRKLDDDGKRCLKIIRQFAQDAGPERIEHVRHNTFHYPYRHAGKAERDPTKTLAEVMSTLVELGADIDVGPDAEHNFWFADEVAAAMAFQKFGDPRDKEFLDHLREVRSAAHAFAGVVLAIYIAYCRERNIGFEIVE